MVYVITDRRAIVGATNNEADALVFAQIHADAVDRPGEATAHILVTAWDGPVPNGTTHVYANRFNR